MSIVRRILGEELILLINGEEKEVKIWSIGLTEKNQIVRKHRKKIRIGSGKDASTEVDIDDDRIIEDILNLAFQEQIIAADLDETMDWVYDKYFNPKAYTKPTKKCNTSESSEVKEED